ncbi:MAG: GDP-mannose 4,6-dehydratase [Candidatus Omnitrophota bacterium]
MNWKKENIFITGGDGFIGAWLAKGFVERGANVVILVRDLKKEFTYKLFDLEDKLTQVQGDLADYQLLERVLSDYSIQTCFHLAAQSLVQIANQSPVSTFESNIRGTWNLLEACRKMKTLKRIIVASSDKAYGAQKKLPYTEKSPLLGLYPYDASKACEDILAQSYFFSYGLPIIITRNANTYGPGDLNFSRIIPDAICCVLKGKEFVIRSDGTPERDYMYVEDAVGAYISAAEQIDEKGIKGEPFNFGTGKAISVIALFQKIAKLCGKPNVRPKILGTAKNEIDRQYLATDKAEKLLGWKPRYSLEAGLSRTIEWYRDYLKIKT